MKLIDKIWPWSNCGFTNHFQLFVNQKIKEGFIKGRNPRTVVEEIIKEREKQIGIALDENTMYFWTEILRRKWYEYLWPWSEFKRLTDFSRKRYEEVCLERDELEKGNNRKTSRIWIYLPWIFELKEENRKLKKLKKRLLDRMRERNRRFHNLIYVSDELEDLYIREKKENEKLRKRIMILEGQKKLNDDAATMYFKAVKENEELKRELEYCNQAEYCREVELENIRIAVLHELELEKERKEILYRQFDKEE